MYFRQYWTDKRLEYDAESAGLSKLIVSQDFIEEIWNPDAFFINEREAEFHEVTVDNQFLRILPNGEVLKSIRYIDMQQSSKCFISRRLKFCTKPGFFQVDSRSLMPDGSDLVSNGHSNMSNRDRKL